MYRILTYSARELKISLLVFKSILYIMSKVKMVDSYWMYLQSKSFL